MRGKLRRLWIQPPLAFARLGNSDKPLDAFGWGPNDYSRDGTGKTTIRPGETLTMGKDGRIECSLPGKVTFKDRDGIRPVCPYFELWGRWGPGPEEEGPVTWSVLVACGLHPAHLEWTVEVANLKPYFMTRDWQTRIEARVKIQGNDFGTRHPLEGTSPGGASQPLVPAKKHIPLGAVRLSRPSRGFPGLRLRFTPARGNFYGPTNLGDRWRPRAGGSRRSPTAKTNLFLNPLSSWCSWKPGPDDPRGKPEGQYAQDNTGVSLGLVDDVCDGIIRCRIPRKGMKDLEAVARIVVGPPDYAPDRRPLVSLADGLKDRVGRHEVFRKSYVRSGWTEKEIVDLMERAYETVGLVNLDVFNDRVDLQENREAMAATGIGYREGALRAFPLEVVPGAPLPLSERGREHHRRLVVPEVLKDFLRKRPDFVERWVREPLDPSRRFDAKMPALMRGAAGQPLHLTRRQYDLLRLWVKELTDEKRRPAKKGARR
jgi:hypothetical protein